MLLLSILTIPFIAAIVLLFVKHNEKANYIAIGSSVVIMALAFNIAFNGAANFDADWILSLNARFILTADGLAKILILLTAISFPVIFITTSKNELRNRNQFLALMLFTQTGLLGVFLAGDALLFYFFWELALIPVYFLCSIWGGEKRIAITFKFFIYTFLGSLFMLIGIILVYTNTTDHSFLITSFKHANLTHGQQLAAFALFFTAFAIKMPIFPLHTWQPDAYEQSPTAVTMVLSAVMVKMGLYGIIRWLLPLFPAAAASHANFVIVLSLIGVIYASFIAIRQDDVKRLIAYSSIAHIGLMCAAIFSLQSIALEGVMIQMFSHGINIIGLWIVIELIEKQLGTRKISQLGGLAHKAPVLTILLVVIVFANIALPLTNAFVGEFMMFGGLFRFNIWYAAFAGISIILAAVYTLNMVQKVFYGETNSITASMKEISLNEKLVLILLVGLIFIAGVYPQPFFELTKDSVATITARFK